MLLKKHFSQADKFTAIKNPLYSLVSRSVSLHVQSSVRVLCTFYIWIQHAVKLLYSALWYSQRFVCMTMDVHGMT